MFFKMRLVLLCCFTTCNCVSEFQHRMENNNIEDVTCQCVPSNLCADNDNAVNGDGLLDIRYNDDNCPNYFDVCCETPIKETETVLTKPIYKGCGYQNPIPVAARITSDSKHADFGELPWTVIILQRDSDASERNIYKCGGSLINPQVVITAAHCVIGSDPNYLTVRAGEWNTNSEAEPIPHQDLGVQDILIHPNFHRGSLRNDIALLFLSESVVLTDNIGLICLPPPNYILNQGLCLASGWGRDAFKKGKHSSILKKVDLPLVSKDECLIALRKTRLGNFYKLHRSFLCAGGEKNKDTCKGDGGSPLICPIPGEQDRYFQIGIVSWGIGCGESETPGVYVNVPMFSKWIDKQLRLRKLDTLTYQY